MIVQGRYFFLRENTDFYTFCYFLKLSTFKGVIWSGSGHSSARSCLSQNVTNKNMVCMWLCPLYPLVVFKTPEHFRPSGIVSQLSVKHSPFVVMWLLLWMKHPWMFQVLLSFLWGGSDTKMQWEETSFRGYVIGTSWNVLFYKFIFIYVR